MDALFHSYGLAVIYIGIYMIGWFIWSIIKRRNDVADTAWGLGFILVAWLVYIDNVSEFSLSIITPVCVSVWGIRLAWHIHKRNHNRPEDARYKRWREEWGSWVYIRSFFQIYVLQGILLLIISAPVIWSATFQLRTISGWLIIGACIWLFGFVWESVGDAQLRKFLKNPNRTARIMKGGLWRYSRHPNYFGEVTQWWGLWIIALATPWGWLSIIGPMTITLLITKVSGIPLLEQRFANDPEFAQYKETTNALIPWRPKSATKL